MIVYVKIMENIIILQGRQLTATDIHFVCQLLETNPTWNRTRLSKEICINWNWRRSTGDLKDIACRTLLRKLQDRGLISLPAPVHAGHRKRKIVEVPHCTSPITESLSALKPVRLVETHRLREEDDRFSFLLDRYHYLGLKASFVGENMRYLAYDSHNRPLGCLLFGAAAWKTRPRDEFIGWDAAARQKNLSLIANNTRFLIFPWVTTRFLASHLLSLCLKRLNRDWRERYGHPLCLVETFVDSSRFQGTCYQAANWILIGQTKGRSRQDRDRQLEVPIKHIYVYPLLDDFRQRLGA
jgi:hypothetical protein